MKRNSLILMLGLAALLLGADPVSDNVKAGLALLQDGQNQWNVVDMEKARDRLLSAEKLSRGNPYCRYHVAFADYCLALYHLNNQADRAVPFLAEAESILEKMQTLPENQLWAEASALYGTCLGLDIAVSNGQKALSLAAPMQAAFNKALAVAKQNPRVNLLQGLNLLHTPAMWGGGAERAMPYLQAAIEHGADESPYDPLAPTWGKDEALLYMGEACRQQGDRNRAAEWVQKALAANPQNGHAQMLQKQLQNADEKNP